MNMAFELEDEGKSLSDYIKAFKRRKKQMLVPAGVVFGLAVLAALFWPPTYKSSATILIEQQQIPKDLVSSTVTSLAAQQIEVIKARIMTVKNIMGLVKKYGLYTDDELKAKATSEIVEEFIDDVSVDVLSANIVDPKTGRPTEATIAFTLSFEHSDPNKAMKVTNELSDLFLAENLRDRTEQSASTSSFLKEEVKRLSGELAKQEQVLAEFKEKNEGSLPERYQYNLQVIERTERDLLDSSLRLKELEKHKLALQSQLDQLSPYAASVTPDGKPVLSDYDRLKSLKSEYRRKISIYSADHPDVIRLKREIDTLEKEVGGSLTPEDYAEQLRIEKNKLSELEQKYTADYPKVIEQRRIVEKLEKEKPVEVTDKTGEAEGADNPAYVQLDSQIQQATVEIRVLKESVEKLKHKKQEFDKYIQQAPMVEKQYKAMQRDYSNASAKYQEMQAKEMAAEMGKTLEQERKGERFTLIDPAVLPEEPESPNRPAIIFLGLVFAMGAGIGIVIILEALSPAIRGRQMLTSITGSQPLVTIPYIEVDEEITKDKNRWIKLALISVACVIIALAAFHFLVKPLDVTWYLILRKIGLG